MRVLLLADTHLGFDLPRRRGTKRLCRGPDFFRNFELALAPARRGEVDLVVHGGDVLYRSKVPADLVNAAFAPLRAVADSGVPVIVVPGNHERSNIPFPLFAEHPDLYVLDRPRTVELRVRDVAVAIGGFGCIRNGVRDAFVASLDATGWRDHAAGIRLLCLHQTVEGARVGPVGYTFRGGADVVPGRLLPADHAAVLAGHIHRHQVLRTDLAGRPLPAPVFYPGSIERTSLAERNEEKGYLVLDLSPDAAGGRVAGWRFETLPARPLVPIELDPNGFTRSALAEHLRATFQALDPAAAVQVRLRRPPDERLAESLRMRAVRALAPPTMIVTVRWPRRPAG